MIKLTTGKYKHLSKEKEYAIWAILNGEQEAIAEQRAYINQVENVYLDYTDPDCPASYKAARAHLHTFSEQGSGNYAAAMGMRRG